MEGGKITTDVKSGTLSGYTCSMCKKVRTLHGQLLVSNIITMIHAQNQDKTKDDFSRSQWRRHGKRRCRDCVLEAKRLSEQAKLSKIKKIQAQQSADLAKYMISQKEAVGGAPLETSCNKETTSDILASAEAISTCEKVLVALSQDIMVSGLQIVCG